MCSLKMQLLDSDPVQLSIYSTKALFHKFLEAMKYR